MMRLPILPLLTACRCRHMASVGMPLTKGVAGSTIGHACRTNSYRLRRAFSARSARSSISGALKQALQLLEFIGGKSAVVVGSSIGFFLRDVYLSREWLKSVENHLDGPGRTLAGCFPRQCGELVRCALGAQGIRKRVVMLGAAFGITALSFMPPRHSSPFPFPDELLRDAARSAVGVDGMALLVVRDASSSAGQRG